MPAERTRGSSRGSTAANQLVWTVSTGLTQSSAEIAFAPNITPGTFNDPPPPMVEESIPESVLFPPPPDCTAPRRSAHSKKKPENHIPRPPNAFILFRSSFIKSQHVSTEVETNHSTLSKIIGLTWQNLPNEERQIWHAKARVALEEHKRRFPQYAFKPLHSKGRGAPTEKRKVREVGPKDHKRCAKIAELLVEGKKGQDLDAAIQEFDKHHVPEVVTRFEAPITATMFHRSTSPQTDDIEISTESNRSSPAAESFIRSSSTEPTREPSPVPAPSTFPSQDAETRIGKAMSDSQVFDLYSFTSDSKPSFDFTFSFDTSGTSLPIYDCDSFAQAATPLDTTFTLPSSPTLSVDTSFLNHLGNWTSCPSPVSTSSSSGPPTPSFIGSPSPEPYISFAATNCPADYTLTKPYDDIVQYPVFSNTCSAQDFSVSESYPVPPTVFDSFNSQEQKVHMVNADLDFSAFMETLPQYTL